MSTIPYWVWVLIAIVLVLLVLFLLGIRFDLNVTD